MRHKGNVGNILIYNRSFSHQLCQTFLKVLLSKGTKGKNTKWASAQCSLIQYVSPVSLWEWIKCHYQFPSRNKPSDFSTCYLHSWSYDTVVNTLICYYYSEWEILDFCQQLELEHRNQTVVSNIVNSLFILMSCEAWATVILLLDDELHINRVNFLKSKTIQILDFLIYCLCK